MENESVESNKSKSIFVMIITFLGKIETLNYNHYWHICVLSVVLNKWMHAADDVSDVIFPTYQT